MQKEKGQGPTKPQEASELHVHPVHPATETMVMQEDS